MNANNWWANKLGSQAPAAPPTPPVAPYIPVPSQAPVQQPPQYYQQPMQQEQPRLPQSAMQSNRCPGCGSGNYGGTAETRARCYDCGYPITQSGTGVKGQSTPSGPAQPAKQVQTGGWNPTTIVDRIG